MKTLTILFAALIGLAATPKPHPTGWRSSPTHAKGLRQLATHPRYKAAPLPPAASVERGQPPIYDQGDIGSCVANAAAAAFDMQWRARTKFFTYPSRLDLYQNCLKHDGVFPRDFGTYTSTALWVLRNRGVLLEKKWPYDTTKLAERGPIPGQQRAYHSVLATYDVNNLDHGYSVKQAISNAQLPVLVGGYVYAQIFEVTKENPFIEMPQGYSVGGHEILVVGYDDNMVHNGRKGFARIRNSWGTSWGDNGMAWIPYDYVFNPKYFEDFGAIQLTGRRPPVAASPVRDSSENASPARKNWFQRMLKR